MESQRIDVTIPPPSLPLHREITLETRHHPGRTTILCRRKYATMPTLSRPNCKRTTPHPLGPVKHFIVRTSRVFRPYTSQRYCKNNASHRVRLIFFAEDGQRRFDLTSNQAMTRCNDPYNDPRIYRPPCTTRPFPRPSFKPPGALRSPPFALRRHLCKRNEIRPTNDPYRPAPVLSVAIPPAVRPSFRHTLRWGAAGRWSWPRRLAPPDPPPRPQACLPGGSPLWPRPPPRVSSSHSLVAQ